MSSATDYELDDAATITPAFMTSQEATLLASARAGDPAAFECLVMPHWDALLRVTQRILRNREDATCRSFRLKRRRKCWSCRWEL
jgi:hypothetical protein